MTSQVTMNRCEAELVVSLLEYAYASEMYPHSGRGFDLAHEMRKQFGMLAQPDIGFGEFRGKSIQDVEKLVIERNMEENQTYLLANEC